MPPAVSGDDVDYAVVPPALGDRHRRAVLVEQVRMECPADDLVAIEIDLQHAGLPRDTPSRVPDEVAQRVGDQRAVGELDRLQTRAGGDRSPRQRRHRATPWQSPVAPCLGRW